ncbi:DNA-dependent RNA polymerase subunit epsilon [Lentilactobacillus sp. Marseille-Q4993]|uniref:DNA-dependent RNA polymerase subunit epsilon n=1 Tax=Lentilactobacillus sp. Marseille-Q4993 TaxID=3039492 RepID=UPI0024BCC344|nr:DNA-dependent RNA polymerase subunit epsilon [Lentilactobacillus sp. Marseille-Q4993]
MIFKVIYQENKNESPSRETSKALYVEADTEVDARSLVQDNTNYIIEFIEPLSGSHLEYEQQSPDFKVTEFN